MYFLDVGEWLLEHLWSLVDGMARHIFNFLCSFIYGLIIDLYNMFDHLCRARLLDNEIVSKISERIGLILGIIMLFFVIFAFIQMLLDPDKITDKTNGAVAVIKRTVLVVVMLGVSNFLFSTLYDIQRIVVESNVISKLLLPYTVDIAKDDAGNNQFGSILAEEMFMAFYQMENLDEASLDDLSIESLNKINKCQSIVNSLRNQIIFEYDFSLSRVCLQETINVKVNTDDGVEEQEISLINFNWFLAPIVGLFIVYFIFTYCISVGVRMVQLMFLEIVSPMAIVSYLSPKKDTMFSKWTKMYFATYLDVFIRIAIINFVVFLISTILAVDAREGFIYWETLGNPANFKTKAFYSVIMVLALLTFAKKVPDLLKDLFPAGASKLGFGLKSPKALFDGMVGGNVLNKGYGLASKGAKAIAFSPVNHAKRLITGIDYATSGKGFWNGYNKNRGPLHQWLSKKQEALTPNLYKRSQENKEGRENVNAINRKWISGVSHAKKLINKGFGNSNDPINPWTKALDGKTRTNYDIIFKHEEFKNSKFAVDAASNKEEELRYADSALRSGQSSVIVNGITYGQGGLDASILAKELDKAQKTLKGLEEVHVEISKQYQDDAKVEKEFKFIKNNDNNPAVPGDNHRNKGI